MLRGKRLHHGEHLLVALFLRRLLMPEPAAGGDGLRTLFQMAVDVRRGDHAESEIPSLLTLGVAVAQRRELLIGEVPELLAGEAQAAAARPETPRGEPVFLYWMVLGPGIGSGFTNFARIAS